ncbi:MAG TPA: hypothetical protein VGO80_02725 [Solirubrobacteraceae bacterium]|nr:hypothetical protein [Solirubrobacteraceae bacterium]
MERDLIRYDVELEMLERHGALADSAATDLLRAEFALAHNAGYFDALAPEDIEFDVLSRSTPQEGVTRYAVELRLLERRPELGDEQVAELLRRAFTDALNASYFLRACTDDNVTLELLAREAANVDASLRPAA